MPVRYLAVLLSAACCYAGCTDNGPSFFNLRSQPVVSILSPKSDSTYLVTLDSLSVEVGVSSEVPISNVVLFIDSARVKEFPSPPYSYRWDIRFITGTGQHVVAATAQTRYGVMGISPPLRITLADPNPTQNVRMSIPAGDSVTAIDSIYLEATTGSPFGDSLITKLQIYVDYNVIHEFTSPPFGFTWVFRGLKDKSSHVVYAKAYDWRYRYASSPPKKIFVRIRPRVVYTPYLSIGNKWFYKYHSRSVTCYFDTANHCYDSDRFAFIVRQVIDTTSDGWRLVSVTTTRPDSVSTSTEYWINLDGNIYVYVSPSPVDIMDVFLPRYLASLTHDSTWNQGATTYLWKVALMNWFGQTYKTEDQVYFPYLVNASRSRTYRTAEGIGPVGELGDFWMLGSSDWDTTTIVGALLNGVLLGDSTNTVR